MTTEASINIQESPKPDQVAIVHVTGEVDETNLPQLEQVVSPLVKEKKIPVLLLNFEGLEFINSKVIGYLASTFTSLKRQNHEMVIAGANEAVNDILALVGFDSLVNQFDSVDEAINAIQ